MKVVFIGAGNVATHLAIGLKTSGFDIVQIYSHTHQSAQTLAEKTGTRFVTSNIEQIVNDADLYIFSVTDSVLASLIAQLPINNGLWLHTAGSISLDVFNSFTNNYGVLYPFQTFSKEKEIKWSNIPLLIEANSDENLSILRKIAEHLSSKITILSSEKRRYVHLTGVFACNFVNQMYTISQTILEKAGLHFDIALPLIDETCNKIHTMPPYDAQTGPAVRYDLNVIEKHLAMIEDKEIKEIYRIMSDSIHHFHSTSQK